MRLKLKFCFALAYSRPKNAKLTPVMQATTVQLNTIDVVRCCLGTLKESLRDVTSITRIDFT